MLIIGLLEFNLIAVDPALLIDLLHRELRAVCDGIAVDGRPAAERSLCTDLPLRAAVRRLLRSCALGLCAGRSAGRERQKHRRGKKHTDLLFHTLYPSAYLPHPSPGCRFFAEA